MARSQACKGLFCTRITTVVIIWEKPPPECSRKSHVTQSSTTIYRISNTKMTQHHCSRRSTISIFHLLPHYSITYSQVFLLHGEVVQSTGERDWVVYDHLRLYSPSSIWLLLSVLDHGAPNSQLPTYEHSFRTHTFL